MRYVIALKPRRECSETPADLIAAIRELPDVEVLEGVGLRAVTVEMEAQAAADAEQRLRFATVSPSEDLNLL